MLKRSITYEDFNGDSVTEDFYFNLSRTEIVDLETSVEGGLEATLKRIIATKDGAAIVKEFKRLVLVSYGKKSDDGKRFIKNDQMREEFSQTAAYDSLFMELAMDENAATEFIKGIIPAGLVKEVESVPAIVPPVPPTS